jgi:DNA polymerase elongation subunit (family B)
MEPKRVASDMLLSRARTKRIMKAIWTEGYYEPYIYMSGIEYKRVDAFPLLGRVQMDLANMVFDKKTTLLGKELDSYLQDLREKLYSHELDEELVISKTPGKEINDYKSPPPHVRAAMMLQARGVYRQGEKVNYVMVSVPKGNKKTILPVVPGEEIPRIDATGYAYYYDAIKRLIDRWVIHESQEQTDLGDWTESS